VGEFGEDKKARKFAVTTHWLLKNQKAKEEEGGKRMGYGKCRKQGTHPISGRVAKEREKKTTKIKKLCDKAERRCWVRGYSNFSRERGKRLR